MRTELTTVQGSAGCYALAYTGVAGTFQANHVSYDDFMKMFGGEPSNLGSPSSSLHRRPRTAR